MRKGRLLEIRHGLKTCYAQREDVGPFYTDLAAYVFGDERPSPNANDDAGIDVMPVDSWRGICLNPACPESLHHQSQTQAQSGRRDSYDAEAPWTCQSLTA